MQAIDKQSYIQRWNEVPTVVLSWMRKPGKEEKGRAQTETHGPYASRNLITLVVRASTRSFCLQTLFMS